MNNKAQTGKDGEQRAAEYLMGKGYELLERNYRYKRSEIDIIIKKEQLLVFVEVKTRSYSSFGYPEDAVDGIKIKKVI
ncbi:YraN family protein [Fulvivirga ulvae]|uniref:YraN family protein n=1 Tax=Fulvivirga ulvae TaxID=2904245 RepID=UPI002795708A|nr:YraN family protein [Fulvivirga ulvae]